MAATLTRGTAGKVRYDQFGSDTSADYDPAAGTLSVSSGYMTCSTTGPFVCPTASGILCQTLNGYTVTAGTSGPAVALWTHNNVDATADRDGYRLEHSGTQWLLRKFVDNGTTTLDSENTPDPANTTWYYIRVYVASGTVYGRYGAGDLSGVVSGEDSTYTSGFYGGGAFAAASVRVDNFHSCTTHLVTVTTLPAGSSVVCSDGATTATANTSAGTATVDCGAVLFPLATITAYDSTNGSGNVLVQLTTGDYADMCGGLLRLRCWGRHLDWTLLLQRHL